MQVIAHRKHAINVTFAERWLSGFGGGLLLAAGLGKRSASGLGLALIGADLVRRGLTGHSYFYETIGIRTAPRGQGESTSVPYELGIRVDRGITISRPRAEVFRFFRDFQNLPGTMEHVQSVTAADGNRFHWRVRALAGRTVEWDAVIHNEIENELIAWRTLEGADVDHAGSVRFQDAPGGRGTELRVELQYNPPAGVLGAALSRLWGEEPTQQIEADLHRLKQALEAGEVLTTEGQPHGGAQDQGRENRPPNEWEVQAASEASFPASDAPSYTR